ncbi:MAG: hypothetical protein R3B41_00020 [Candidatus Doudnabacteria bacterium]
MKKVIYQCVVVVFFLTAAISLTALAQSPTAVTTTNCTIKISEESHNSKITFLCPINLNDEEMEKLLNGIDQISGRPQDLLAQNQQVKANPSGAATSPFNFKAVEVYTDGEFTISARKQDIEVLSSKELVKILSLVADYLYSFAKEAKVAIVITQITHDLLTAHQNAVFPKTGVLIL